MTDKRGQVLQDALEVINGERNDQYGEPEDSFSLIAEYWSVYIRNLLLKVASNKKTEINDVIFGDFLSGYDVSILMCLLKVAREAHQTKRDNLVDAAGYIGIAGDMHQTNTGKKELCCDSLGIDEEISIRRINYE